MDEIINQNQLVAPIGGQKAIYHFAENNHLYVLWNNNVFTTRSQVIKEYRHRGLWVTYVDDDNNIYTEMYISDNIDDVSWNKQSNWKEINRYE